MCRAVIPLQAVQAELRDIAWISMLLTGQGIPPAPRPWLASSCKALSTVAAS